MATSNTKKTTRQSAAQTDAVDRFLSHSADSLPGVDLSAKQITARVVRLNSLFIDRTSTLFAEHDLNLYMYVVIAVLRLSGKPYTLRPKQLLDSSVVTSGGLSNVLNRLEKMALIRRDKDNTDGRGVMVILTRSGARLAEKMLKAVAETEKEMTSALSKKETTELARLLRKLCLSNDM